MRSVTVARKTESWDGSRHEYQHRMGYCFRVCTMANSPVVSMDPITVIVCSVTHWNELSLCISCRALTSWPLLENSLIEYLIGETHSAGCMLRAGQGPFSGKGPTMYALFILMQAALYRS